jgi:hypothetical protein
MAPMGEPRTRPGRDDDDTLDLRELTPAERKMVIRFADLLKEGRARPEARHEALRLWPSYSALPPAASDEDEAARMALDAVAEARRGA